MRNRFLAAAVTITAAFAPLHAQTTWRPTGGFGTPNLTLIEVFALAQDGDTIDLGGMTHVFAPSSSYRPISFTLNKAVTIEGNGGTIETRQEYGPHPFSWVVDSGSSLPLVLRDVTIDIIPDLSYYGWGEVELEHQSGDVVLENVTVNVRRGPNEGSVGTQLVDLGASGAVYCRDVSVLQDRQNDRFANNASIETTWPGTRVSARAFYADSCRFEGGNGPHTAGFPPIAQDGSAGLSVTAAHAVYNRCTIVDGVGGGLLDLATLTVSQLGQAGQSQLGTVSDVWNSTQINWVNGVTIGSMVPTTLWPARTTSTAVLGRAGWDLDVSTDLVGQVISITGQQSTPPSASAFGYLIGLDALSVPAATVPVSTPFGLLSVAPIASVALPSSANQFSQSFSLPVSPVLKNVLLSVQLVETVPTLGATSFTLLR